MKIKLFQYCVKIGRKTYYWGDKVKVQSTNGGDVGIKDATIEFGEYPDGESENLTHLGFYVKILYRNDIYLHYPLLAVINGYHWRFVK